jgi:putative aldouronate transport system substrate-binding protein
MWVHTGFLKNVNLAAPTTIDEFHTMLTAFKNQDANGNGDPNDEIPFMGAIDNYGSRVDTFIVSAYVYDDGENRLYLDNGKVTAAYTKPEFQQGLRTLNQWFNEGLLARDSFIANRTVRSQLNSAKYESVIGAMPDYNNAIIGTREAGEPVRHIDYVGIKPLKGPNGLQVTRYNAYDRYAVTVPAGLIPSTSKNPALIIRWLDWFLTEEGTMVMWWGPKGMTWTDPDPGARGWNGQPAVYKVTPLVAGQPYFGNVTWGLRFPFLITDRLMSGQQAQDNILDPSGAARSYYSSVNAAENYAPYGMARENLIPPMFYSTEDASGMATITTNINTYVEESIAKFVVGDLDINTGWTTFQNTLKNLGLDRYLSIIQSTYDKSAFKK